MNLGTVAAANVKVRGDTSQFGADVKSGIGASMKQFARRGAVATGVAVGAALSKGITSSVTFDQDMREVFTLLPGISQEAMDEMKDQLLDLGSEYGAMTEDTIPAMYDALSAGVEQADVFDFLTTSQKFAQAGATDVSTAVDGLTTVVNAFGLESADAGRIADQMFGAVRAGKTTVDELSASMFNVAPIAATLGVKTGEVAASFATLTSQGTPTSVASNQMKAALTALTSPTEDLKAIFTEFAGVTAEEFLASGGSMTEAFGFLQEATGGSVGELKKLLGSQEAVNAVLGLTGANADTQAGNLEAIGNSAGSVDEAYETMAAGIGTSWNKIKASTAQALIEVGDQFAPFVSRVADSLTGVIPKISDGIGGALDAAKGPIGTFFGAIADPANARGAETTVGQIAQNLGFAIGTIKEGLAGLDSSGVGSGISKIAETLGPPLLEASQGVRAFVGALKFALQGNPDVTSNGLAGAMERFANFIVSDILPAGKELIGLVINDIVPAVVEMRGHFIDFVTSIDFGPLAEAFREGFGAIRAGLAEVDFAKIAENFGKFMTVLRPVVNFIVGVVADTMKDFATVVGGVVATVGNLLEGDWRGAWNSFSGIIDEAFTLALTFFAPARLAGAVGKLALAALKPLKGFGLKLLGRLTGGLGQLPGRLGGLLSQGLAGIGGILSRGLSTGLRAAWNGIKAGVLAIARGLGAGLRLVWNGIKNALLGATRLISNGVKAVWNGIRTSITRITSNAANAVKSRWTALKDGVIAVANTLRSRVVNAIKALGTRVGSAVSQMRTKVTNLFTQLRTKVQSIANGVRDRLASIWGSIRDRVSSLTNSMRDRVVSLISGLKSRAQSIMQSARDLVVRIWDALKTRVVTLANSIKTRVVTAFNNLKTSITSPINQMRDKIITGFSAITAPINRAKDAIQNIIDKIKAIPSSIPLPSVPSFDIPFFADGGIVRSATQAVVGEAGPELILPLTKPERMRELMRKYGGPILASIGIGKQGAGTIAAGREAGTGRAAARREEVALKAEKARLRKVSQQAAKARVVRLRNQRKTATGDERERLGIQIEKAKASLEKRRGLFRNARAVSNNANAEQAAVKAARRERINQRRQEITVQADRTERRKESQKKAKARLVRLRNERKNTTDAGERARIDGLIVKARASLEKRREAFRGARGRLQGLLGDEAKFLAARGKLEGIGAGAGQVTDGAAPAIDTPEQIEARNAAIEASKAQLEAANAARDTADQDLQQLRDSLAGKLDQLDTNLRSRFQQAIQSNSGAAVSAGRAVLESNKRVFADESNRLNAEIVSAQVVANARQSDATAAGAQLSNLESIQAAAIAAATPAAVAATQSAITDSGATNVVGATSTAPTTPAPTAPAAAVSTVQRGKDILAEAIQAGLGGSALQEQQIAALKAQRLFVRDRATQAKQGGNLTKFQRLRGKVNDLREAERTLQSSGDTFNITATDPFAIVAEIQRRQAELAQTVRS